MTNDRPHIIRPGRVVLTAAAIITGYFILGRHVPGTVVYVGAAVAIGIVLGVGYLMREPIEDEDYAAEPDQVADRWATVVGFFVLGLGIGSLLLLTDGIVQAVAHYAITLMLATHVSEEVYQAKAGGAR